MPKQISPRQEDEHPATASARAGTYPVKHLSEGKEKGGHSDLLKPLAPDLPIREGHNLSTRSGVTESIYEPTEFEKSTLSLRNDASTPRKRNP